MLPAILIPLAIKLGGHLIDYAFRKLNELPAEKAQPVIDKVKKNEDKKQAKKLAEGTDNVQ